MAGNLQHDASIPCPSSCLSIGTRLVNCRTSGRCASHCDTMQHEHLCNECFFGWGWRTCWDAKRRNRCCGYDVPVSTGPIGRTLTFESPAPPPPLSTKRSGFPFICTEALCDLGREAVWNLSIPEIFEIEVLLCGARSMLSVCIIFSTVISRVETAWSLFVLFLVFFKFCFYSWLVNVSILEGRKCRI